MRHELNKGCIDAGDTIGTEPTTFPNASTTTAPGVSIFDPSTLVQNALVTIWPCNVSPMELDVCKSTSSFVAPPVGVTTKIRDTP